MVKLNMPEDDSTTNIIQSLLDRLEVLERNIGSSRAWQTYTPVLAGAGWAIGNGTITGSYIRIGKTVHFRIVITFGSTSTYAAANPTITYPIAAAASTQANIRCELFDTSANDRRLGTTYPASTTTLFPCSLGTNNAIILLTNTSPWTWATGDVILIQGTYEAA
jgi:hypothetical protein